jgi:hypothetical protein
MKSLYLLFYLFIFVFYVLRLTFLKSDKCIKILFYLSNA